MKILLNVSFPHQKFNAAVRDGTIGAKIKKILDAQKPSAVYFTDQGGLRSAILIVDLAEASQVPALAEPWFLTFDADVNLRVVMTPEDLAKAGLDQLGQKWG